MKIGILTFHNAINYGAVLQAYALKKHLSSAGHCVEIINYTPKVIEKDYKVFTLATPLKLYRIILYPLLLAKRILLFIPRLRLTRKFVNFNLKALSLSEKTSASQTIPEDFEAYVIGSDQVWNYDIVQDSLPVYLGRFNTSTAALRIAYAASAGAGEKLLKTKDDFDLFNALSVRELSLRTHLQQLGVSSTVVLDPTLLISPAAWHDLADQSNYPTRERYILLYMMYDVPEALKTAKKLACQKGIKLKIISNFTFSHITKDHFLHPVGPEDFVRLFRDAECIITTSFHGTAFSLIFNKNFYFISSKTKGENRIHSLLSTLGLNDRMVENVTDIAPIDYSYANSKILDLRAHSTAFLQDSLTKN